MSLVMLKGRVFARAAGWVGIVSNALLIVYIVGSTVVPESGEAMMLAAMPGGLLMLAWNVMVAIKLLRLRKVGGV